MKAVLLGLVSGTLFGVGLILAGMTRPAKVIAFLDVAGAWDPSLAFVMVGAIAVHFVGWRLVPRLGRPFGGGTFALPTRTDIDRRLVFGAVLFGAGWGLGGYCPGPALTSAASGAPSTLLFVGAMLVGIWAHARWGAS